MAENDDNTTDSFYGGVTSGQEKVSVEDYQSGYFNPFYQTLDTSGIQVATIDEGEDEEDTTAASNILDPVGDDNTVLDVFRTTSDPSQMGLGTVFGTEDAATYINNYNASANKDKSGDLFSAENLEAAGGVPAAVATLATGLPISGLAAGMSALVKKEHRKNAAAIVASGNATGDMFTFNGQTVSRAPGSKIFSGNLGGLSQGDMYRSREISKGFIPDTMTEMGPLDPKISPGPQGIPQATGLAGVTRIDGAIMDAFGTTHTGQRDEGGHMMTSASQAQALREQEFRDAAKRQGVDISGLKGMDFTMAAVDYKKSVDKNMRAQDYHGGFFHKTSNMTAAQNNQALKDRINFGNTSIKDVANKYNLPGGSQPSQPSQTFVQTSMPQSEAAAKDSDRDNDRPTFRDSRGQRESVTITAENVSRAKEFEGQYDEDDFIDDSGQFTEGFGKDDSDSGDKDDTGCVIATHGLSTGGFTPMEKAKAELWCQKTYHGKWYGEAFRRGYRAAGQRAIDSGNAEKYYQEFKDFVAYGRGVKRGWRLGFNYYRRTLSFFLSGLFISE